MNKLTKFENTGDFAIARQGWALLIALLVSVSVSKPIAEFR